MQPERTLLNSGEVMELRTGIITPKALESNRFAASWKQRIVGSDRGNLTETEFSHKRSNSADQILI